jgi:hypothetical protein
VIRGVEGVGQGVMSAVGSGGTDVCLGGSGLLDDGAEERRKRWEVSMAAAARAVMTRDGVALAVLGCAPGVTETEQARGSPRRRAAELRRGGRFFEHK